MPDVLTGAALSRRDRAIILGSLAAITALAWADLVRVGRQTSAAADYERAMAAMGMSVSAPWTVTDISLTFLMWLVMMIGMMTASAAPVLLLFAATAAARQPRGIPLSTLAFGIGYLVVWAGFSFCAALAQWALHEAALLSATMQASSAMLGGGLLVVAGAYQLTPVKVACLTHCRSPLGFLMTNWRSGTAGAFQMGMRHGAFCLGCCWALMTILFVVGVMNLAWVAVLAAVVLIEKLARGGTIVARVSGVLLLLAGLVLMIRPA